MEFLKSLPLSLNQIPLDVFLLFPIKSPAVLLYISWLSIMPRSDSNSPQDLPKNPFFGGDPKTGNNQTDKGELGTEGYPLLETPLFVPQESPKGSVEKTPAPKEERIGHFLIEKVLGKGAFGKVFRAFDEKLGRRVAIKVPHPDLVERSGFLDLYRKEAMIIARMDHPRIVQVYEIGSTPDYPFFLVSRFIEGVDLRSRMQQGRLAFAPIAQMVESIAEGLQHAHGKGLVHRDLKPDNILIDTSGQPCIVDFGVALQDEDYGKGPARTGTPLFNSPEQARNEGHKVDERSDLFSLGVIFYELLTGELPFQGKSWDELVEGILHHDPKSPQLIDPAIPPELNRICLKCLAKPLKERYQHASELAEDLKHYLVGAKSAANLPRLKPLKGQTSSDSPSSLHKTAVADLEQVRMVPKGLRSFDEGDSSFFLDLLPGARDREGLPESIRFWKSRIERTEDTFSVGLIYGPSGCGKSSLLRAGLLPRLDESKVKTVFVEAAAGQTEQRLLSGLRGACGSLSLDASLKDVAFAIRKGRAGVSGGKKVLIVIDQFEQWLHEKQGDYRGGLMEALGQCDVVHLQCVLLVRDDFWLAVSRFMSEMEIDLLQDKNIHLADLFDQDHAKKVLRALGRAYGRLPDFPKEASPAQTQFLRSAVEQLSQENRVISVRLALFAEMMKSREWTPESLKAVGGVDGLAITFLEETFNGGTASPEYRYHQKAVRGVLNALLPEVGSDIKGQMRSTEELKRASSYEGQDKDFTGLLRILDNELRIITPTEVGSHEPENQANSNSGKYYQLAHDYLVPGIRDWLKRKQKETVQGRAEILLEERAALWKEKKQTRQLPSLMEFARIGWYTKKSQQTQVQREMMRQARSVHGFRTAAALLLLGLVYFVAYESYHRVMANSLVAQLAKAEPAQIPDLVNQIKGYAAWADSRLKAIRKMEPGSPQSFAAALALLPRNGEMTGELTEQLTTVDNERFKVLANAIKDYVDFPLKEKLWAGAIDEKDKNKRFRQAVALAVLDPEGANWDKVLEFVADHLTKLDTSNFIFWREQLAPVGSLLIPSLAKKFRDEKAPEQVRSLASEAIISYGKDQPAELFALMTDAPPIFYPGLQKACLDQAEACAKLAKKEIVQPIPGKLTEDQKDVQAQRKANAAIFLLKADQADQKLWDLWKLSDDPRIRSEIIHYCPLLEIDPMVLIKRFEQEDEISTRRALVLSLGSYPALGIQDSEKSRLTELFLKDFANHPDSGYHSALEWTLRQWGQEKRIDAILKDLAGKYLKKSNEEKEWVVTPTGITMVVIKAGSFMMGSSEAELGHQPGEVLKKVNINRPFLIASHEITRKLFSEFENDVKRPLLSGNNEGLLPYWKTELDPQTGISWYDAVRFCNWLSEKERIPKEEWCYEPVKVIDPIKDTTGGYREGMLIKANHWELAGYRLPRESEWEYACRATTSTARFYGNRDELLGKYAWYMDNSNEHLWPVHSLKPNDWGLFGMLGNAFEWCQESHNKNLLKNSVEKITGGVRIWRGGSFYYRPKQIRSAYYLAFGPDDRGGSNSFRPSRTYKFKDLQKNGK